MNPIEDYLPDSYSDTIAVQNWVRVKDNTYNILWSSLDAPMVELGGIRQGYISPAHRCVVDQSIMHPPLKVEDLNKGWIYSEIFCNNFGTNFSVPQVADVLFRYVLSTFEQIFAATSHDGSLPVSSSFLEIDTDNIQILNMKKSEDGNGYIIRLWNRGVGLEIAKITFNYVKLKSVCVVNLVEEKMMDI